MRIVQMSDTHLSHRGGMMTDNFGHAVDAINAQPDVDLVVHTGDLVVADPDQHDDHRTARALHTRLAARLRVVPGNHDVGEVGPDPWKGLSATDARLDAFEQLWGPTWWVEWFPGWAVLGLNSQLVGSGLAREHQQWEWLTGIGPALRGRAILVFLHKPIWPTGGHDSENRKRHLPAAARDRLLACLAPGALRAVGSGHLHRYLRHDHDGVQEIWAPSTAFGPPATSDDLPTGIERPGLVSYDCDTDDVEVRFWPLEATVHRGVDDVPEMHEAMRHIVPAGGPPTPTDRGRGPSV